MGSAARRFQLYDRTLRDCALGGRFPAFADALALVRHLDACGVRFVDSGVDAASPAGAEFLRRAQSELALRQAELVAVGAVGRSPRTDAEQLRALLDVGTAVVGLDVREVLRRSGPVGVAALGDRLALVRGAVRRLTGAGRRVLVGIDHYFDGFRGNRELALEVVRTAVEAGAETIVLGDSDGGSLPDDVRAVVAATIRLTGAPVGVTCQDHTGCAVANAVAAVEAGADQIHGTVLTGGIQGVSTPLLPTVAHLVRGRGLPVVPEERLRELALVSRSAERFARPPGTLHGPAGNFAAGSVGGRPRPAPAGDRLPAALAHPDMPALYASMDGYSAVERRAGERGDTLESAPGALAETAKRIGTLERRGYCFEDAVASLELVVWKELSRGRAVPPLSVVSWRVGVEHTGDGGIRTQGQVRLRVDGVPLSGTGEGATPVRALHAALHTALDPFFPELATLELRDYRIHEFDPPDGTAAPAVRAVVTFHDGQRSWGTVGVHENSVAAVWTALFDAVLYTVMTRCAGVPGG
ncbi:alpha-isopropylmalate synthase regulatory domain-containing protein [Streptomyces sp. NPDC101151]|uniref:alpha-isopropylmalate synthase regulatory domain-containing protein n=1 Tax=Streptomyces sp. NPDC101151 TaxID=3366115 RepID=UPI003830D64E